MQTYPGSCGSTRGHVEKYLVANIDNPDGSSYLSSDILAKCFALMPRLGGGGSQGIQHKANFKDLFQKITYTLEDTIQDIVSLAPNNSTSNFGAGIVSKIIQKREIVASGAAIFIKKRFTILQGNPSKFYVIYEDENTLSFFF